MLGVGRITSLDRDPPTRIRPIHRCLRRPHRCRNLSTNTPRSHTCLRTAHLPTVLLLTPNPYNTTNPLTPPSNPHPPRQTCRFPHVRRPHRRRPSLPKRARDLRAGTEDHQDVDGGTEGDSR